MTFGNEIRAGASGAQSTDFYDHTIDQSLRFTGTAPMLARTFASGGNRRTYTFSVWIKRAPSTKTNEYIFHTSNASSGSASYLYFTNDILSWYDAGVSVLSTNRRFRDFSSWYHIVLAVDTTDSTAGNRSKIYVNGVQETSYSAESNFSENHQTYLNSNIEHFLGSGGTDIQFNGYMAEINFIDGQALTPASFGETKDGVWVPKDTSGLTFGTTGFLLPFGSTTKGASAIFDGSGDNIRWSDASQFDIGSSDDFCLELFTKGDFESNYSYGIGQYATAGPHFLFQLGNNGNIYGYTGNGTANGFDATAHLTRGISWHHIAYVRESGTYRFYIDGVQRHTATGQGTAAFDVSQFNVGDASPASGAPHLNAYISNLRLTIGAARYASGTTFTVPTSTLTNDSSNVKLLAFTTSSITADGSSAAISGSITEGDPVFNADNPFSALIGDDTSGNNNDFTQDLYVSSVTDGIGFEDIVLDSPTNNFSVMNALFAGNSAVTGVAGEGNLKVLTGGFSSSLYGTISTFAIPKDKKIYIEVVETGVNGTNWFAGFATSPTGLNAGPSSTNVGGASSVTYYNRAVFKNGTEFQYHSNDGLGGLGGGTNPLQAGDILGLAIDGSNGKIWFHKNGTYFKTISSHNTSGAVGNTGNPSAGTDELATIDTPTEDIFFVVGGGTSTDNLFVNFGQDSQNVTTANADANDIGTFEYAPPTDYVALCASNLTDTDIGPNQSEQADDNFNTVFYTGNSGTQSITGVGFQPDWLWVKNRGHTYSHALVDSVRGATLSLSSNENSAERTSDITSLDSDGFSLQFVNATGTYSENQGSGAVTYAYVSWNWKAGGSANTFNVDGTGHSSMSNAGLSDGTQALTGLSVNTTSKFSIATFTMPDAERTVAHGLGVKPDWIIFKNHGTGDWQIWHNSFAENGDEVILLNSTAGKANAGGAGNWFQSLSSTLVGLGSYGSYFGTGDYVMYSFASVEGFSKIGTYKGLGSTNPFVYTGFRPVFILLKELASRNWVISYDHSTYYNGVTQSLFPNIQQAEDANARLDFLSNGFKLRTTSTSWNNSGGTFIYLAFADQPFKFANAR